MRFSIIVPIYNASKTLRRCVDSILNQTIRDFELILINDGSEDDSSIIIHEYSDSDNRVKSIDKQNGGVSSARNMGIDYASGEYVLFVDSDDEIENTYLEDFLEDGYDCIISGVTIIRNFNKKSEKPDKRQSLSYKQFADFINNTSKYTYTRGPVAKAFKAEIINNHNIRFNPNIQWSEDFLFVLEFILHSKKILLTDTGKYLYYAPTAISKYKMDAYQYITGTKYIEQNLSKLGACHNAMYINRLWHYQTFLSNLASLKYKKKLSEYLVCLKLKVWKIFPSESKLKKIKRFIELTRVCFKA